MISYDDLQPTDIPWLDLVRVEVANTRHGRVCLRLLPAARWRAATRVEIHVYRGRRLLAETWLRIDGRGQIKRTWVSKHAALGSDGPALAFVLPPSDPSGVTLRVAAAATSTQPAEPLLRNPVNAGDPDDDVRIPRYIPPALVALNEGWRRSPSLGYSSSNRPLAELQPRRHRIGCGTKLDRVRVRSG